MATRKREFPLFSLLTFSLFLVLTQCYHPKIAATKQPLAELKRCEMRCLNEEVHGTRRQSLCLAKCYDRYSHVAERLEEDRRVNLGQANLTSNPFLFGEQRFKSWIKTEAGEFKVLQRFSQQSDLLKGIDDYRLAVYEADPSTFLVPHHADADIVLFVAKGEMTIGFMQHEIRENFDLKRGDAIRVPAGATYYFLNRDISEKLRIFMLLHSVNIPGNFRGFFVSGGPAYYRVFGNEILASAFNTTMDKLERLFGGRVLIVRANLEQIRALSQQGHQEKKHKKGKDKEEKDEDFHNKKKHKKEEGEESCVPFSVLDQKPSVSNSYGQFFLASPDDHVQLQDLDVSVAVMNIEPGAMVEPYFNSRSTIMVLVSQGNGSFVMACPHVLSHESQPQGQQQEEHGIPGEQEQEQHMKATQNMKVASNFSAGDVFIIPAGHPISIASTGDQTLQLVGFGINARNNEKNFLAGQDNIWKNAEPEVKQLSFGVPSMEADEVFGSQGLSYFVPVSGQQKSQQGGESEESGGGTRFSLPSLLDFVGFM